LENKYIHRAKISESKFRQVVKLFALDLTSTQITALTGLNPKTTDSLVNKIRSKILFTSKSKSVSGEFEADESYFGPKRKGRRGRGAGSKTIVFGLYKRNGKVYTEIKITNITSDYTRSRRY